MVKILILSYLNIKETHGYEIQKYIQVTGLDSWTKIKSGSIYYAISKMEKNKEVSLVREESIGSKVRRIYKITEKGKEVLQSEIRSVLEKSIYPVGSEKYILPLFIDKLSKEEGIERIRSHINELKKEIDYWNYWKDIKVNNESDKLVALSFEMAISNLSYSIKWHEALIDEYDYYIDQSKKQSEMIRSFNFDELDINKENIKKDNDKKIYELKEKILNNPKESKEALEELLNLIKED